MGMLLAVCSYIVVMKYVQQCVDGRKLSPYIHTWYLVRECTCRYTDMNASDFFARATIMDLTVGF